MKIGNQSFENPLPKDIIYLDYHATTPTDPRVMEVMKPYFTSQFGNPASPHQLGVKAKKAVRESRNKIANHINSSKGEIIFTSGATESNNIVIQGLAERAKEEDSNRKKILTSSIEHKSVLNVASSLADKGFSYRKIPVDTEGIVNLKKAEEIIDKKTLIVSVMAANNEIGTIQPIKKISEIAHNNGALVHCDAAQALGRIKIDVQEWGVDFLSLSSHKGYGPKGIGSLYIKNGPTLQPINPLFQGGGQEKGFRPGTHNLPSITGFAKAVEIIDRDLKTETTYLSNLRDDLEKGLKGEISDVSILGNKDRRLPSTTCMCFSKVDSGALVARLSKENILISSGSACESGAPEPSHTIIALGIGRDNARNCIRIAVGRFTEKDSIFKIKKRVSKVVTKIRNTYKSTE